MKDKRIRQLEEEISMLKLPVAGGESGEGQSECWVSKNQNVMLASWTLCHYVTWFCNWRQMSNHRVIKSLCQKTGDPSRHFMYIWRMIICFGSNMSWDKISMTSNTDTIGILCQYVMNNYIFWNKARQNAMRDAV